MKNAHEMIDRLVKENDVVLFMKGNRGAPRCGFSATVVEILDEYLPEYVTVDVLADPEVREGVKAYASWPTIPQLYVKGKFVGGCDIVREMRQTGELDELLGKKAAETPPPALRLTDGAVAALLRFHEGEGTPTVRIEIDQAYQYGMDFDEPRPGDVVVDAGRVRIVLDKKSAKRADGVTVDYVEKDGGGGFKIENPNEPPRVKQIPPIELKAWLDEGKPMKVYDVRTPEERQKASLPDTRLLDPAAMKELGALPKETVLVFHCHHGMRSQAAAEQALRMGFQEVYNLRGGIDAWSTEVDPSVPRY
jgi:monothiol glutaredoxin